MCLNYQYYPLVGEEKRTPSLMRPLLRLSTQPRSLRNAKSQTKSTAGERPGGGGVKGGDGEAEGGETPMGEGDESKGGDESEDG